jgi:monoamine oxidase
LQNFALHEFQTTMFQPVGGMDMIGKAFAKAVGDLIRYDAKVTASSRTMAASRSAM